MSLEKIAQFLEEYVDCKIQAGDNASIRPDMILDVFRAEIGELVVILDAIAAKGKLTAETRVYEEAMEMWVNVERAYEVNAYDVEMDPDDNPVTRSIEEYGFKYLYFPITEGKANAIESLKKIQKIANYTMKSMEGD